MKSFITGITMILAAVLLIATLPTEAEGAIYEDTVRLHILANSDSEEDQKTKLMLRDAILDEFGKELSVFESTEDAKTQLEGQLNDIREFSLAKLSSMGVTHDVTVTLSEEWYDTREYENFTLPCGYYTSLRVIIGDGVGKNWWCVMFPPLCLDAALSAESYTPEEEFLITKKYNVKFKLLEIISEFTK